MTPIFCAFLFVFFYSLLNHFYSTGTGDIVAIMTGNLLGRHITDLIENGIEVYMRITVASRHGPWNPFWIYITSFVFFGITAIILGYFIFIVISRFYQNHQLRIQQVRLFSIIYYLLFII